MVKGLGKPNPNMFPYCCIDSQLRILVDPAPSLKAIHEKEARSELRCVC